MIAPDVLRRFRRTRLVVYGILAFSYMLVFFHRVAPGAVASDLMREFATTGAALGTLAAIYFYVYAAMQIPAGVLADTLGVRMAGSAGAFVSGAGSVLFGLAPDLGVASIGRFLVGLGVSVVFVGFMRANAEWWSERRYGFISGLTMFIGNVGALLAVAPLAALLVFASWRTIFVVIGVVSMGVALLTFLFVRDRPEDKGFPSLREIEGQPAVASDTVHWWRDLVEVVRNRSIWPLFFASFCLAGNLLTLVGLWGVPLLTDAHGLSRAEASLYPTVAIAVFAVGCLALGALSDRVGRRKPVLVGGCIVAAAVWLGLLLLPWGPGWSGFALFAALGFSTGGFVVTFAAAKELVRPAVAGMAIALANTGTFFGTAVLQPLFGGLMDLRWDGRMVAGVRIYDAQDYGAGLSLCAGIALAAVAASLYARETYCRNVSVSDVPLRGAERTAGAE